MTATFSTTTLANDKMELIPEHMVILNPEAEYAAQCLYFVWAFKADEPATLDDAICEKKGAFLATSPTMPTFTSWAATMKHLSAPASKASPLTTST